MGHILTNQVWQIKTKLSLLNQPSNEESICLIDYFCNSLTFYLFINFNTDIGLRLSRKNT